MTIPQQRDALLDDRGSASDLFMAADSIALGDSASQVIANMDVLGAYNDRFSANNRQG